MATAEEKVTKKSEAKKSGEAKKKAATAKKQAAVKKAKQSKNKKPVAKKATAAKKKPTETKKKAAKSEVDKKVAKPPKNKALSGFMKFRQEHQAKVKAENPNDSAGQIGKKLGDMWRALSKEEKQAYKPVKTVAAGASKRDVEAVVDTPIGVKPAAAPILAS